MMVFTIPNALSALRIAGVPVFFWLIVGAQRDGAAVVLLAVSGLTDYLDGYLAKRLGQESRLGELLDPIADRLYIVAALVALLIRDLVPIWVVIALVGRDLAMTVFMGYLKTRGVTGLPVHFIGKAATLNVLYSLPLLLLSTFDGITGQVAHIIGWAFLVWGIALYWYSSLLYVRQARSVGLL
jgi:cardiolipin synthase